MAERLESATKIYGIGILLAESFSKLLSPERKRVMRLVDRVLVVGLYGKPVPVRLYTPAPGEDSHDGISKYTLDALALACVLSMQTPTSPCSPAVDKKNHYTADFEKAFEAYIAGEWDYAKPAMQALLVQQPDDQLVQLALDFVQTSDKAAWKGYREDLDV